MQGRLSIYGGGRLSIHFGESRMPVDFFRFIFFNSPSASALETPS